jgi:hypothetical protein
MNRVLHDKDIREPLFDFLEERYGKIRIIEEKRMGRSRADVVMVTESALCGLNFCLNGITTPFRKRSQSIKRNNPEKGHSKLGIENKLCHALFGGYQFLGRVYLVNI